jgi:hypothetical protein
VTSGEIPPPQQLAPLSPGSYFKQIQTIDLIHFGLIPEFIGRFPVLTTTTELTLAELISILYLPTNSIMKQMSFTFALFDIQLHCTERGKEEIAEIAHEKKTGARGLRSIVEKILTPAMFLIPSHTSATSKTSERGDGTQPSPPWMVLRPPRHPLYHAVVIDERSARGERGVVLLTHEITTAEFYQLSEEELRADRRVRIASDESLPHL